MFSLFLEETTNKVSWTSYLPIIVLFALLIVWMVISSRRNKRQQEQMQNMLDSVVPGDEVTMACGMIGRVVAVKGETVTIETSKDRTKVRFLKNQIARIDEKVAGTEPVTAQSKSARKAEPVEAAPAESAAEKNPDDAQ